MSGTKVHMEMLKVLIMYADEMWRCSDMLVQTELEKSSMVFHNKVKLNITTLL